jgi:hypothetical protein
VRYGYAKCREIFAKYIPAILEQALQIYALGYKCITFSQARCFESEN